MNNTILIKFANEYSLIDFMNFLNILILFKYIFSA